jgi:sugar transferase EpsL
MARMPLRWEEKFVFDYWYVDHQSFLLDLKILLLAAWRALQRQGISQPGHVTARELLGSSASHSLETEERRGRD